MENKKNMKRRFLISFIVLLLLVLTVGVMYIYYTHKGHNNVFTKEFKNEVTETFWGYNLVFSEDDFDLIYKKLQRVSLTETKEVNQDDIPNSSFAIIIKTKDENYLLTLFEKYIRLESNYHPAASILGEKSEVTYYKTNKYFIKDKEILDIALKYYELHAKRMRAEPKIDDE